MLFREKIHYLFFLLVIELFFICWSAPRTLATRVTAFAATHMHVHHSTCLVLVSYGSLKCGSLTDKHSFSY